MYHQFFNEHSHSYSQQKDLQHSHTFPRQDVLRHSHAYPQQDLRHAAD